MTTIERAELFGLFKADAHPNIENALQRPDIIGLAVYEGEDGRRRATPAQTAAPPVLDRHGGRLIGVYLKDRMRLALAYLQEHPGTSANAAAQRYGVSRQAVADAIKRAKRQASRNARPVCPCCGQPIPKSQ